ncbi:LolA-like protein [Streptomyces sp. SGAir0957]
MTSLTAAVLLCAGCATSSTDAAPPAAKSSASSAAEATAVVRSAVRATRTTSAYTHQKVEVADGRGTTYRIHVTGGFDLAADRGDLRVRMPGGPTGSIDEIFDGDTVYVRGTEDLASETWGATSRSTAKAHALLRAPLNDPEFVLQQIATMRKTTEVGSERVDGARTTHYRGILDRAALVRRTTPKIHDKYDQIVEYTGSQVIVFADAWVDDAGRIAQTRTTMNMAGLGMTVTLTLSDHGRRVEAARPSASETVMVPSYEGPMLG